MFLKAFDFTSAYEHEFNISAVVRFVLLSFGSCSDHDILLLLSCSIQS